MNSWEQFRESALDALSLFLPIECAGCQAVDRNLCLICREYLQSISPADVQYRELFYLATGSRLPLWYATDFVPPLSGMVHHLKELNRTSIARELAAPLRIALTVASTQLGLKSQLSEVCWVTPPSSRASFRARGYYPTEMLMKAAGIQNTRLLSIARRRADQSTLGRVERFRNMGGAYISRPEARGTTVVLVDDVLTTGATLLECARALRARGATVLGAVTIASTPKTFRTHSAESA